MEDFVAIPIKFDFSDKGVRLTNLRVLAAIVPPGQFSTSGDGYTPLTIIEFKGDENAKAYMILDPDMVMHLVSKLVLSLEEMEAGLATVQRQDN